MNRKKILLVDDDPVVVQALTLTLTANGYDVVAALEGSEAIGVVRKEKPDLILLDVNFPPSVDSGLWSGMRILAWLKRMEEMAKTPVIVITGGDTAAYEKNAMAAGAAAFLHKSMDHKELLAIIRKTLGEEPARA